MCHRYRTASSGKNTGNLYRRNNRHNTGESVDVVITDYGIAINPKRQDLIEAMKDVDLPFKTIEELRDIAYSIAGEPQKVQFGDRVVGVIESRDGTIMDVVRQIKPFEFDD